MTGVHAMAAPLQALREGQAAWWGPADGLFAAAPIVLALQAGRLADRRGYHHPMRIAVALTMLGAGGAGRHLRRASPSRRCAWRRCWSAAAPTSA